MLEGTILVVDDDPGILDAVAELLRIEGYEVETAANGAAALESIARSRPALMLLDMRMPALDGWGVARMLAERGIRVPTLVMTAARDGASWASEIGADGYLAKPFGIGDLLEAVRRGVDHPPLAAN
jgi:DNA-binding response OmpR family regulator